MRLAERRLRIGALGFRRPQERQRFCGAAALGKKTSEREPSLLERAVPRQGFTKIPLGALAIVQLERDRTVPPVVLRELRPQLDGFLVRLQRVFEPSRL